MERGGRVVCIGPSTLMVGPCSVCDGENCDDGLDCSILVSSSTC